jgi:hypothetical protein
MNESVTTLDPCYRHPNAVATVLQNLPLYPIKGQSVFGSCFLRFPGLRG